VVCGVLHVVVECYEGGVGGKGPVVTLYDAVDGFEFDPAAGFEMRVALCY
jgi:hypothetical protein